MDKQTPVVLAVIRNTKNQVLIAKRKDEDTIGAHDMWELVGGKIEFGETPEQALIREVKEETGLDVKITRLIPIVKSQVWEKKNGDKTQVILISYECLAEDASQLKQNLIDEVQEAKFINISELDDYNFLPLDKELILSLNLKS